MSWRSPSARAVARGAAARTRCRPATLREEGPSTDVLHSYSGGADLVPVYRDLGLAFSFAGPVTYPNARRPIAAARAIPDALLLAETDAPDQAPAPHRGSRSKPAFVADVIAGLAAARGTTAAKIAALMWQYHGCPATSGRAAPELVGPSGSARSPNASSRHHRREDHDRHAARHQRQRLGTRRR